MCNPTLSLASDPLYDTYGQVASKTFRLLETVLASLLALRQSCSLWYSPFTVIGEYHNEQTWFRATSLLRKLWSSSPFSLMLATTLVPVYAVYTSSGIHNYLGMRYLKCTGSWLVDFPLFSPGKGWPIPVFYLNIEKYIFYQFVISRHISYIWQCRKDGPPRYCKNLNNEGRIKISRKMSYF